MKIKVFINAIIILSVLCLATFAQTVEQKADELLNAYTKQGRFREAIEEYSWIGGGPRSTR